ncbi:hypothetical protein D9756_008806 [Leucocoprinus leucothites]|uniref:Uncharacterized protein n=1 Tax=Leucocoprinus leucothites TaxID=201217 RepID=A0A8H5FUT8_9AGAR|nr:hypothetical protein D9756_008806 [Leucoagaricus leucothites]
MRCLDDISRSHTRGMALDDKSEFTTFNFTSNNCYGPQLDLNLAFAMSQQDTMTSSNTAPTRFPRRSEPSDQSFAEFWSRFYLGSTETDSSHSTTSRITYQNLYLPQEPYLNREVTYNNKSTSGYASSSLDSDFGSYDSPPQTDLDSTQRQRCRPDTEPCYFGGVLDSPLVMSNPYLKSQPPLSPPLTIPLATMSLPLAESEAEGYLSSPSSEAHDPLDQEYTSYSPSPLTDTLTLSNRSSCSTLYSPPPLSPISPTSTDWFSPTFPTSIYTPSSPQSLHEKRQNGIPFFLGDSDTHPFHDRSPVKSRLVPLDNYPGLPLLSFPQQDGSDPHPALDCPLFSPTICESPKSIVQEDLERIDLEDNQFPPFAFPSVNPDPTLPFVEQAPADRRHEAWQTQQPKPDSPEEETSQLSAPAVFPPTFSPSIRNSSLPELDDLWDDDHDFPDSLEPPSSPSRRPSYAELPDDDIDPSSSTSSADPRDTLNDTLMLSPPESLGLMSLPGADIDDDLIPVDLAPPKPTPDKAPLSLLRPRLLVLEDDSTPHPSSNRRSPSPEPCDNLDTNAVDLQINGDDELKAMCGVMKKTKEREGAAKWLENIMEDEERVVRSIARNHHGHAKEVDEAWNKLMGARSKSRRLKEKVRATATLLRLKLADKGWKMEKDASGRAKLVPTSPAPVPPTLDADDAMKVDQPPKATPQKRLRINNPHQLLAKMLMDQQEPLYNPSGRAGLPFRRRTSPLTRSSISAADMESTDSDKDNGMIPDIVDIPDVEMHGVDEKEDLLDELVLNMGTLSTTVQNQTVSSAEFLLSVVSTLLKSIHVFASAGYGAIWSFAAMWNLFISAACDRLAVFFCASELAGFSDPS